MSFVEFRFLWFFLLVFIVYWAMRNNAARKVWLLLCSYVFTRLGIGSLLPSPRSTTVDYIVGQMLGRLKVRHGGASGLPPALRQSRRPGFFQIL
jgi:hypothetical protein